MYVLENTGDFMSEKRKILLSFLGTNSYTTCSYKLKDFKPYQSRFFQESLIQNLNQGDYFFDEVFIFVTKEARERNLVNRAAENNDIDEKAKIKLGDKLKGLGFVLKNLKEEGKIGAFNFVDFPDVSKEEKNITEMFKIIYNQINKEDEVSLDITHSFRFMPMLVIPILNYARFLKKINIYDIFYGAFESLGSFKKVKEKELKDRIAPVFSLKWLNDIQELANATNDFVNYGITDKLNSKSINNEKECLFTKTLDKLSKDILACRGKDIVKGYDFSIDSKSDLFEGLFKKAKEKVNKFDSKENTENLLYAAKWCLDHHLIQQGFTIAQEFILTYILEKLKIGDYNCKCNRNNLSSYLSVLAKRTEKEKWHSKLKDSKIIKKLEENREFIEKFKGVYSFFTQYRNNINHAGFGHNQLTVDNFQKNLDKKLKELEKLLS
jgi:CRISPR-associated Csx2 family protein